jgi:ABC-2 type transport system ATP-binding protein
MTSSQTQLRKVSSGAEPLPKQTSKAVPVIEIANVVKTYGNFTALSGLDLRVMPGEVYGLLGPNGAGKSTTIKILMGLVPPTSGSVRIMGYDVTSEPMQVKSVVGYVPETSFIYDSLSPRDLFEFIASVRKVDSAKANERASKLAGAFGLAEYYDSPIATLSMGTKQKVTIVASMLHDPPLLLLDEAMNGLDVKSNRVLKDLISLHVEKNNGSVLFSTHIMEVAEHICTRIGIIYGGKIVAEGSLDELRGKASEGKESTLEEVFLRLTHEEEEVEETARTLREAFAAGR